MPTHLSEAEIKAALSHLEGWKLEANALEHLYHFENFVRAMMFVNRVATLAEAEGHHPDIIIAYNRVTLRLTTHDAGGITSNDVEMAEKLNNLPGLKDLLKR